MMKAMASRATPISATGIGLFVITLPEDAGAAATTVHLLASREAFEICCQATRSRPFDVLIVVTPLKPFW